MSLEKCARCWHCYTDFIFSEYFAHCDKHKDMILNDKCKKFDERPEERWH
jgi:hypothetical protein